MKKIFFALCAVAALASCSNNEIVNLDQEAIAFDNAFVDNGTRAADNFTIETDELLGFNVWATTQRPDQNGVAQPIVPILKEVIVCRPDLVSSWVYPTANTQYWIPGNTYQFVAVKNGTVNESLVNGLPATISYNATTQADVLYAADTRVGMEAGANAPVAFTFDHLLSKAYFTVKVGAFENTNYTYKVKDVQINNAVKEATYTVGGTWAGTSNYTAQAPLAFGHVAAADKLAASSTNTSDFARLLVPATYTDLNVTCTIETLYGDAVIDVQNYNTNIPQEFVKGYVYNFILTLGAPGDAIEFTVTRVNEWIPTGETAIPGL